MLIAKSTIQEVFQRLDAIAVVEDYLRLEKRGGRYWGRCPFHAGGQEKTPSFHVEPDQKLYYCFGCSKGGSIIDFVMEMEKIDYPEAIKTLARKFAVEISYEGRVEGDAQYEEDRSRKDQLLELYRRTALSFGYFLQEKGEGKPALDYLFSRNVNMEMVKRFKLGFSPIDRNWLYPFLQGKGYSAEFLDNSGLFSANYRGMSFFSGRLMFPIADRQGRIVSFAGRELPEAEKKDAKESPKYINTRETDIYKKGQILYALDLALPEIRRTKTVYLVEGYMDAIAMHQAGLCNAVAPCGTAFTDEQARLLSHWADSAVLVFDADDAGQNAAVKGIVTCRKNNLLCFLYQPGKTADGVVLKDPAEIFQKYGAETLKESLKNVIIDVEYIVARSKALYDVTMPKGKTQALAMLYPYLDALGSQAERDDCVQFAADQLMANKAAVIDDFGRWLRSNGGNASKSGAKKSNDEEVHGTKSTIRMNDELFLLTVVSVNTCLYPEFRALIEIREIEDQYARELFIALEECFINEESGIESLIPRIESAAVRNFIIERGISPEFKGDEKRDPRVLMYDGYKRVKEKRLRRRLAEIEAALRLRDRNTGLSTVGVNASGISTTGMDAVSDIQDLITEKMDIDAKIRKLEGKT